MKVLHVVGGNLDEGAAKGSSILHENLRTEGIESTLLTNSFKETDQPGVVSVSDHFLGNIASRLRMRADNFYKLFYEDIDGLKFSPGLFGRNILKTKEYIEADIVHLHWICNGFIDIKYLSSIDKPIVWTLRDMWPLTGGCHHPMDCSRYEKRCGACPQLNSKKENDLSTYIQGRKEKSYPKKLTFVGMSEWMTNEAKKSRLLGNYGIETISNNIDTNSFFPSEKRKAREYFDIVTDKKVLLFGSQHIKSIYKGYDILLEILEKLDLDLQVLYFGRKNTDVVNALHSKARYIGFLNKDELRQAYTAADMFISPSRVESFGKTVAEAMACGTPAVCFDQTGSTDIVDHKINGYIAKPFSTDDFISGIHYLLDHPDRDLLAKKAVEKAALFEPREIAKRYIELYSELIGD